MSTSSLWLLAKNDGASFFSDAKGNSHKLRLGSFRLICEGGVTLDKVTAKLEALSLGICRTWPCKALDALGWGWGCSVGSGEGTLGSVPCTATAAPGPAGLMLSQPAMAVASSGMQIPPCSQDSPLLSRVASASLSLLVNSCKRDLESCRVWVEWGGILMQKL